MSNFLCNLLRLAKREKKKTFLRQRRQMDSAGSRSSCGYPDRKLHKKILWCAIMVMVLQQDIPSDQLIHYRRSLIPAVDPVSRQYATQQFSAHKYGPPESLLYKNKYGDNYYHARPYGTELYPHLARASTSAQMSFVRKRMPHFWPRMRNDSPFSPSAAQRKVREAFKQSCDCFNIQPWSGGAEPDGYGPYSRTWWYSQAGPSGLWYYNYFIAASWATFFADNTPKWCMIKDIEDAYVSDYQPNTNFSTQAYFYINNWPTNNYMYHTYIKTPIEKPSALYIWPIYGNTKHKTIGVYAVEEEYDITTLTWNNQPATGALLSTFDAYCDPRTWRIAQVKGHNSIVLKAITLIKWTASYRSSEYTASQYTPYFIF